MAQRASSSSGTTTMSMRSGKRQPPRPKTAVLHAGYHPAQSHGVVTPPEHRSSTMAFSTAAKGERAFDLAWGKKKPNRGEQPEYIYARLSHPDAALVEQRLEGMEPGAGGALVFSSGMSAITGLFLGLWRSGLLLTGSHLLYTNPVYGGTEDFFTKDATRLGFVPHAVRTDDLSATARAMDHIRHQGGKLGMVYLETPANPTLSMTDIAAVAAMAKAQNRRCLVVVDNTFFGLFQQPFIISPDVDVVVYSATKFIGGHADLVAGAVLVRPGQKALLGPLLGARTMYGTIAAPSVCAQILRSLPTLHVRMEQESRHATMVAKALQGHPQLAAVIHPALFRSGSREAAVYRRNHISGPGSMVTLQLQPSPKAARHRGAMADRINRAKAFRFLNRVSRNGNIALAVSLGGVESLIEHPASMTHSEVDPAVRVKAGITELTVRLSVGLEDPDDLVATLTSALDWLS